MDTLSRKLKIAIVIMLISSIIWSFLIGFFVSKVLISKSPQSTNLDEKYLKQYEYDRLIVQGKDKNGEDLLIRLQLARKQIGENLYRHYYSGYLYSNKKNSVKWVDQNLNSLEIAPIGFIKSFDRMQPIDGTSDQKINFKVEFDGVDYDISTNNFVGDFIVKDVRDYLRFESVSTASVKFGNDNYSDMNAYLDRIISDNIETTMLNPKADKLDYESHSIVLWDNNHNMLLIDISDVKNPSPDIPYFSHKWILYKDTVNNTSKKILNATLDFKELKDKSKTWKIEVPELDNSVINLKTTAFLDHKYDKGLVTGTITNSKGETSVYGQFTYQTQNGSK